MQTVDGGVNPSWASQTSDSDETFPRSICGTIGATANNGAQVCIVLRATRDGVRDSIGMVGSNPVDAAPFFQLGAYGIDLQTGDMRLLGKTQNLRTMFSTEFKERRFYLYNSFDIKAGQYYVLTYAWWQGSAASTDTLQGLGAPQSNIRPPFGSGITSMSGARNWSSRPSDDAYMPESLNWSSIPSSGSSFYPYLYLCSGGDML
ncbi:hypothetical protein [Rhodococcus sp. NPDC003348]